MHLPLAIFIGGPTATGKSDAAIELACRLGGEIISVDSMLVYQGLDIGTAKPSPETRARVPHHLIDIVPITQHFDAMQFVERARSAAQQIHARKRIPIFCGGTGLYFTALVKGISPSPPADAALREQLEQIPLEALLAELRQSDPDTHESIDRNNRRRVVRAIEIIRLTGKPYSQQRVAWKKSEGYWISDGAFAFYCLGLDRPVDELNIRIDARVDWMFENGLVEETRQLLGRGLRENSTAMQALGYRQVIEYLEGKSPSLESTIKEIKERTRRFAKRQRTWFRNQLQLDWVCASSDMAPKAAADIFEEKIRGTR